MTDEPRSIGEKRLADADPEIIRQQLGADLRMELSARDFMGMEDGLMFAFGPQSRAKNRKIIIKLNGSDLYEVEVGYIRRSDFKWVVVGQMSNVDAEALSGAVRRLAANGLDA